MSTRTRKSVFRAKTGHRPPWSSALLALAAAGCASAPTGAEDPGEEPAMLGADLTRGWLDPWPHRHFSPRGTPYVHMFDLEPAFLDRDLFLDVRSVQGPDGDEIELEAELEWALTRRLGLVVEAPFAHVDPDGAGPETGIGDLALAPRALLVETPAFLLAANLEVSVPSGDEGRGLGSGEVGLAPSVSTWLDLGHWMQLDAQAGTEHGLESGEAEAFYGAGFAWSFQGPSLFPSAGHAHGSAADHFPPGLTSAIVELTGRRVLEGADADRSTAEVLTGLSHDLDGHWEVRAGYRWPVGSPSDLDRAFVVSLIHHF